MESVEYVALIQKAKKDSEKLLEILNMFEPLVKKYSKKLFLIEKEDAEQEMRIAIIEAVKKIPKCETDGQCLTYINNAVKYRYIHLCKKSIAENKAKDNYIEKEEIFFEKYEEIETLCDWEYKKSLLPPKQQKILSYLIKGYSDKEIAKKIWVARQYINRIKKKFY